MALVTHSAHHKVLTRKHFDVQTIDHIVSMVALVAPFTNVPQLIQVYTGSVEGVSLLSWCLYTLFVFPFLIHAAIHHDRVIFTVMCINLCINSAVVLGILLRS